MLQKQFTRHSMSFFSANFHLGMIDNPCSVVINSRSQTLYPFHQIAGTCENRCFENAQFIDLLGRRLLSDAKIESFGDKRQ